MPFDNTNPDTKPATDEVLEALQRIREGVSRAWCVGSLEDSLGNRCLVGWVYKITEQSAEERLQVLRLLAIQVGFSRFSSY